MFTIKETIKNLMEPHQLYDQNIDKLLIQTLWLHKFLYILGLERN
jgi:hypothetical protein